MIQGRFHVLWLAVIAVTLSSAFFLMDGRVEPNFADEGYLWHGMTALKAGQVPIRDFHAYDPGRYCWVAAWSYLLGDGLVSMRISCVIFQCIGVWCGLLALRRLTKDWRFLTLAGFVLVLWMIPTYKVFEQAAGLMAIYAGVRLIESPRNRNFFLTGVFIGLMAILGRNHGVYQVGAFGLITLFLSLDNWRLFLRRVLLCGTGIILGYLPQLLMVVFIPGFFDALLASIAVIFSYGSNVPLPVPWPWRAMSEGYVINKVHVFVMGLIYMGLIAFVLLVILQMRRLGWKQMGKYPVLLASACITICYIHFTFSRPDWVHLAHSVPLWIVGVLALCFAFSSGVQRRLPVVVLCGLCVASLTSIFLARDVVTELTASEGTFIEVNLRGQKMSTTTYKSDLLTIAHQMNRRTQPDESLMFIPHIPGLYPAVGRLCPTQQSYYIIPMSLEKEEETIQSMKDKKVKWILLQDIMLDGRQEHRFRHTNPMIYDYIQKNFEVVGEYPVLDNAFILRRKE